MNAAHLHLVLNHFPLIGALIGFIIVFTGVFKKNALLQKTGLTILFLSALITVAVFQSGEGAEEVVEKLPGINEELIETHEEQAEIGLWLYMALGLTSLIALILHIRERSSRSTVTYISLFIGLVVFVWMGRVNNSGAHIMHPEIHPETAKDTSKTIQ